MSFSGGVYTLPGPALVTGEVVSATENNQFRNDVAGAFNVTMLRNGTSTATANLPMGGYKLTGLGAPSTNGDSLAYGAAAVVTTLTSTSLTATRVPYVGTGGLLQDASTFTFDGTTLTAGGFSTSGNISAATATVSGNITVSGGTANGVAYLNGSKVLATGSALTFDGTTLLVGTFNEGNKLTLSGTAGFNGTGISLLETSTGNNTRLRMYQASGVSSYDATYATGGNAHAWLIGGSEQMRLTSTGLGIGTSSPYTKLGVTGNATFAGTTPFISFSTNHVGGTPCYWQWNSLTGLSDFANIGASGANNGAFRWIIGGGTEGMRLDSSGNLGLGVTPSAWEVGWKGFEFKAAGNALFSGGNADVRLTAGAIYNAGWKYGVSGASVSRYDQGAGSHTWFTAPSGTAGNAISFTQAMTLDASGNLMLGGTTSVNGIAISKGSGSNALIETAAHGNTIGATSTLYGQDTGSNAYCWNRATAPILFGTSNTERMRIDSSGNVGIGTSSPSYDLQVGTYGTDADSTLALASSTTGTGSIRFGDGTSGTDANAGLLRYDHSNNSMVFWTSTAERMRIDSSGQLKTMVTGGSAVMNAYGCRAWVNFDGTAAGTFAGGASTVTRNVGTTTCTVTTASAHGLITGNVVYNNAITGLVAGARTVTVTNSTTFTFTSTETTSIAAATITFAFANIRASGNVGSVADVGVGNYYINFTTAMPDAYYSVSGSAQHTSGASISIAAAATSASPLTAQSFPFEVNNDAGAAFDSATVSVQVFR